MDLIHYADNINPAAHLLLTRLISNSSYSQLRFLEFGCSTGALGHKILSDHHGIFWVGVDINKAALEIARQRLSAVHMVDLNNIDPEALRDWAKPDCIIMVDVLEHIYEPHIFLDTVREYFGTAKLIIVLPNISCYQTYDQISGNDFKYSDSGIFDKTHRTFYTPKSAIRLLAQHKYQVSSNIVYLIDPAVQHIINDKPSFPYAFSRGNYTIFLHDEADLMCISSYGFGLACTPVPE